MMEAESSVRLEDIPVVNFGSFVLGKFEKFRDYEALVDSNTEESLTFAEVKSRVERIAGGLQNYVGVSENDVICIMSANHVDYVTSFFATNLIGATFQPINPLYAADDIKRAFDDVGARFVITIPVFLPKIQEALRNRDVKIIMLAGEAEGCIPFSSLLDPSHGPYTTPDLDWKNTPAVLFSSSGTTGFPKTVRTSHYNLVANFFIADPFVSMGPGDTFVTYLPLFHIYGLFTLSSHALSKGVRVIMMSKFNMVDYLNNVQKYKCSTLHTVPPVVVGLTKFPALSNYDLSHVHTINCGAAPLKPEVIEALKNKIPTAELYQGYGMTEIGLTHGCMKGRFKEDTVGKRFPCVEVQVVDVDTGSVLGPCQEGEIWVRGPVTSSGYVNRPEETADMFLADGWVKTGDIGYEDEDQFLTIVDRLKELIKYKGSQVPPASLEAILYTHNAVADACVVGVPDDEAGELPRAYVLKKPGCDVTEPEILDFVSERVAPHMKLRGGVEFVGEIPRTLSGKILRKHFRQKARDVAK